MPESTPPEPQPQGTVASTIHEARGVGRWLSSLSPTQFQSIALAAITVFVCMLAGYIVFKWDQSNQTDKIRADKQVESVMRENNAQAELIRNHCSSEIEKSRQANSLNLKGIQDTLLLFISTERAKDRAHETERDKEHMKQMRDIQNAWAAFAIKFADLERFLRGKPECVFNPFVEPLAIAPAPKEKVIGP